MPRETFNREMQQLEDDLLAMGSIVEKALVESVEILKRRDAVGARRLIAQDPHINSRRFAIESDAIAIIATQQPMAGDLRTIASVLDIASELERIGDYAKGIAKITLMLGDEPLLKPLIDIPRMAELASGMLHRALEAFVRRDVELARAIPAEDDDVDALYNQIYSRVGHLHLDESQRHRAGQPPAVGRAQPGARHRPGDQHLRAGYLYRHGRNRRTGLRGRAWPRSVAADWVTNICEQAIFTVPGEMVELAVDNAGIESLAWRSAFDA